MSNAVIARDNSAAQTLANNLLTEILQTAGLSAAATGWKRTRRRYVLSVHVACDDTRTISFTPLEIEQLPIDTTVMTCFIHRVEAALDDGTH